MKVLRCQCKNITNNKKCLNKSKNLFVINNKKYCTFHANYYHNKYAIKIQSNYRGYKKRKYLNNIYIKLPYDIQMNVLYFIKREFYIERLHKKIDIIVNNKINKFIASFVDKYVIDKSIPFSLLNYLATNQENIRHIYKLFKKYESILTSDKKFLNYELLEILKTIHSLLNNYEYIVFNAHTNYIFELTYVLYNRLNIIMHPEKPLSSEC